MAAVMQFTEQELKEYHEVFVTFDQDRDGRITVSDLLNVGHRLGLPTNERDLGMLIGSHDINGHGKLDFEAFVKLMARSRRSADERRQHEDEMRRAFRVFDRDGNGWIDQKELRATMKSLGEKLSKDDIKAMIKAADKNGDGKIDYEEFIKMMYHSK